MVGLEKILGQKNFGSKKIWVKNNVGQKNILGQKKFLVNFFFGAKKGFLGKLFRGNKFFGSKKFWVKKNFESK